MKQALYWKPLKNKTVQCQLCPKFCVIKENEYGNCKARKNTDGKLYSMVYGKAIGPNIDHIEKKPFYHFLPGSKALSFGTTGCNLHCLHCQNYDTSQATPEEIKGNQISPKEIVNLAKKNNCESIAYTYNEPTIFYEYMLDTAKLAKKEKILNVIVSNGFINPKPLKELCKYIDAANIDLKGFNNKFYKRVCSAMLEPVLETLKTLKKENVWLEVTNLIIPDENDDPSELNRMCIWLKNNLGTTTPLHFSAFYPMYKMKNKLPTSPEILFKAKDIAKKQGLKYVYIGNIMTDANNTYCPKCKNLLIKRGGFLSESYLKTNKCPECNEKIDGVL